MAEFIISWKQTYFFRSLIHLRILASFQLSLLLLQKVSSNCSIDEIINLFKRASEKRIINLSNLRTSTTGHRTKTLPLPTSPLSPFLPSLSTWSCVDPLLHSIHSLTFYFSIFILPLTVLIRQHVSFKFWLINKISICGKWKHSLNILAVCFQHHSND